MKRWFLRNSQKIGNNSQLSSLEKERDPHFNNFESPLLKGVCAKFGWNRPSSSEKVLKMWKGYGQTEGQRDRQTDDR